MEHGHRVRLLIGDASDRAVAERVLAGLTERDPGCVREGRAGYRLSSDHDSLAAVIDELEVVIGSRYHNLIFALKSGCPALSVGYAPKCTELLESAGLDGFSQMIGGASADELEAQFRRLVGRYDHYAGLAFDFALRARRSGERHRDAFAVAVLGAGMGRSAGTGAAAVPEVQALMAAAPRVTLGVPVYNGERYLGQALDSLMAQDYDDLEIVISDNASTDATQDICRAAALADDRIRYERQSVNKGGVWNVNHLVHIARGRDFKWAYYDDVVRPGFVAACVDALDEVGSAAVMAHTRVITIDENSQLIDERDDADLGLDLPNAHDRVFNLLSRLANQTEFGLMRIAAMRMTRGVRPYIGSEMFFLAEMATQGSVCSGPRPAARATQAP